MDDTFEQWELQATDYFFGRETLPVILEQHFEIFWSELNLSCPLCKQVHFFGLAD